jgi:hypothetical protein
MATGFPAFWPETGSVICTLAESLQLSTNSGSWFPATHSFELVGGDHTVCACCRHDSGMTIIICRDRQFFVSNQVKPFLCFFMEWEHFSLKKFHVQNTKAIPLVTAFQYSLDSPFTYAFLGQVFGAQFGWRYLFNTVLCTIPVQMPVRRYQVCFISFLLLQTVLFFTISLCYVDQ